MVTLLDVSGSRHGRPKRRSWAYLYPPDVDLKTILKNGTWWRRGNGRDVIYDGTCRGLRGNWSEGLSDGEFWDLQ